MARVKRGNVARKRRKKILQLATSYYCFILFNSKAIISRHSFESSYEMYYLSLEIYKYKILDILYTFLLQSSNTFQS